MPYDLAHDSADQGLADDGIMHYVSMTEDEFRDLLRAVADEARHERATTGGH